MSDFLLEAAGLARLSHVSLEVADLERSRAFIPQLSRPKTAQTVTIFDWDDTLLCTTHLEMLQRQHGAIPAQARATAPRRAPFKQPP